MRKTVYAIIFIVMMGVALTHLGCSLSVGTPPGPVSSPQYSEPGPPPWAPAHGHRAKYRYYYYPDANVYLDTGRGLYFYYSGNGWQASVSLPTEVRIQLGGHVDLEMDDDRPYRHHRDVVKRYPPGQLKKKGKGKGRD